MQYFIGADAGTTNMKALLFSEDGNVSAQAKHSSPIQLLEDGGGIIDPDAMWNVISSLIASVVEQHQQNGNSRSSIAGIAITGMGEAGVPLDESGRSLYPIIAWFDPRTEKYLSWWRDTFDESEMQRITNLKNQHIFTVNKMLWLKENQPEQFAKTKRWHCVPDYIAFKLSGASAMDYSIATRTMMFDVEKKDWSETILNHAGIAKAIMPKPVPSGTKIGTVSEEAEKICGLKAGTPVFAGGHDHICGALAAGVIAPGTVLDSSGTCEEVLVATSSLTIARELGKVGFNAGYHVVGDSYYISGGIPASGASVDWYRREFSEPFGEVHQSTAGANGLLFLPHLRGSSSPERDKVSKGAFIGVQARHNWADFMQAVYEGVAFELRLSVEQLSEESSLQRIVSIGGGTMNEQWLQIKSDVLGREIEVPAVQECTAFGAAILAGIGAGVYTDVNDALKQTYRIGKTIKPNMKTTAVYHKMFNTYRQLYLTLHKVNQALDT